MHGPPVPAWLLVALCAAVGAYCLLRMVRTPQERGAAGADALMGIGMALMAVPAGTLAPGRWSAVLFTVVFGGAAVAWALPPRRCAARRHHVVGSAAMVYMVLAMAAAGPHAHHAGTVGLPVLTWVLVVYYLGYVLVGGVRLVGAAAPTAATAATSTTATATSTATAAIGTAGGGWTRRPELVAGCRVCLGIGMAAMLLGL